MPVSENHKIGKARLLLVEGDTDEGLFLRLCQREGISNIQIIPYYGKNNFRNVLGVLRVQSGFEAVKHLGIVRDADTDAQAALRSVQDALAHTGLPLPGQSVTPGEGALRTLIQIMPPGRSEGCLETLLWRTIPEPTASCIDDYIECTQVPSLGSRHAKARVYAYIAAQRKPELRLGESARAGYWDFDHPAFEPLTEFVRSLAE